MPRKKKEQQEQPTVWEVTDELWEVLLPILTDDYKPNPKGGRPPTCWRPAMNAIIHRLRSGCQWNHLPKELGDDSTAHRWFRRWCANGVMLKIWSALASACGELGGVDWEWQSADGSMGKARFGGEKGRPQPDRPGQAGGQEEHPGGGRRGAPGGGDRRG